MMYKRLRSAFWTHRVKRRAMECRGFIKANYRTDVTPTTVLGDNVNFNGLTISGGGRVEIGDNFHSGVECLFITQIHNYDYGEAIPYDDTYLTKDITIQNNVWIGSRVIVLGEATIGEGAIIQAGSVVVGEIPKCSIAGGAPAKVFKYRDVEHYETLKKQKKFH